MLSKDRAQGCLIGLAVGDVLGCPVEAMSPHEIKTGFGRIEDLVEAPVQAMRDTYYWRLPGLHSDDTQQALSITDILVENHEIKEDVLLEVWKEMAQTVITAPSTKTGRIKKCKETFGCHRGTGSNFRRRVKNTAAFAPPANGNGAAMRVAPVGVWFCRERKARIENAVRSALATSSHPHAAASAAAVAAAVALGIDNDSMNTRVFLEAVANEALLAETFLAEKCADQLHAGYEGRANEFSDALFQLAEWHYLPLQDALTKIADYAKSCLGLDKIFATKSFALTAVPTALLISARHKHDFTEGVIEAVNLGGDTDTIGALVGAILGAKNGLETVPVRYQQHLLAREQVLLRGQALATGRKGPGWICLPELERELTLQEARARSKLRGELMEKGFL
ncbi:MAG: ADP-ribosylglycohydrolase family protein [Desulfobacterales bacterium]|nr:ADP-ribosylglycohydrolase family protein [Desulfobacterales bacterium]